MENAIAVTQMEGFSPGIRQITNCHTDYNTLFGAREFKVFFFSRYLNDCIQAIFMLVLLQIQRHFTFFLPQLFHRLVLQQIEHIFLFNFRFDVLVNGGGAVTLQFQRSPFHPMTRTVFVPWNQVNSMAMRMFAVFSLLLLSD